VLSSGESEAKVWEMDMDHEGGMLRDNPMFQLAECANAIFDTDYQRVIGTASNSRVLIYDAETAQLLTTLQEAHEPQTSLPARALRHRRACVSPDNSMVMCDGVLWDPRNPSQSIHKFDRFANYGGGTFHPNRPEVIISSAIWDVRKSFKLLRWSPSLDQMHTVFNPTGDVIYGVLRYFEEEQRGTRTHVRKYKHLFRTVDAVTYEDITTVELKDNVADLFVDAFNEHIAVMETSRDTFGMSGTTCRLYNVGKTKASVSDDEEEEDQDDDDADDSEGNAGGDSGRPSNMLHLHDHILNGDPQGLALLSGLLGGGSDIDADDMGSEDMDDDDDDDDDDEEDNENDELAFEMDTDDADDD